MAVVHKPVTMNGDIQDLSNTPPRDDAYEITNLLDQVENICLPCCHKKNALFGD